MRPHQVPNRQRCLIADDSFRPQDYHELTPSDIRILARVLSLAALASPSAARMGHTSLGLPSHLTSKIPWLTSLCSLHKMLNPLPLISLRGAMRTTSEEEFRMVWQPLSYPGDLQHGENDLINHLSAYVRDTQHAKCAACDLSSVAHDAGLLTALGSIIIARLKPSDWKRSKRIMWIEACIEQCSRFDGSDEALRRMWQSGSELWLRRRQFRNRSRDRPYIDDYITYVEAEIVDRPFVPTRSPAHNEQVAYSKHRRGRVKEDSVVEDLTTACKVVDDTVPKTTEFSSETNKGPIYIQPEPNKFDNNLPDVDMEDLFPATTESTSAEEDELGGQHMSSVCIGPLTDSDTSHLLELYRHSNFPKSDNHHNEQDSDGAELLPRAARQRNSELAKYPRHKLAQVTIPKNNFGIDASANGSTSGDLWRKMVESRAPRLRIGRGGQIKGPFDSVSDMAPLNEKESIANVWI